MSWQSYVDTQLLATKNVSKAAIHGNDGNPWATSAGFSVSVSCMRHSGCLCGCALMAIRLTVVWIILRVCQTSYLWIVIPISGDIFTPIVMMLPGVSSRPLTDSHSHTYLQQQISAADAKALIAGIKDPTPFQAGGIKFGGIKYTFIRADAGRNVYGRQVRTVVGAAIGAVWCGVVWHRSR